MRDRDKVGLYQKISDSNDLLSDYIRNHKVKLFILYGQLKTPSALCYMSHSFIHRLMTVAANWKTVQTLGLGIFSDVSTTEPQPSHFTP